MPENHPHDVLRATVAREVAAGNAIVGRPTTEAAIENAALLGHDAGLAAGSWIIDGNTSTDTARAILRGIEDGDPAVLDQLPASPLSGEWADGLLPRDVLTWYDRDEDADDADDILTAYEDGYSAGVLEKVERSARAIL